MTMVIIHENMFGGSTDLDMYRNIIDSIMSIDVVILFNSSSGIHSFEVFQSVEFYVLSVEGIWYLEGLLPYPVEGKATEEISFDAVFALYQ